MLTISELSKRFGGRTLFEDVTLTVVREDRIGLVGPNGAGKSTLFSLILGTEQPDTGNIAFQRGTSVGYLPQESAPAGDETVLQLATGEHMDGVHADGALVAKAKQLLSGLSFRESDFERPAREMSGGWVMRAHLARLLVQEPDLLMLDEPTNHLDLESLIWLQSYLKSYPGAILMISHDREFLNQLITSVLEIRLSRVFRYRGNYDEFLVQREANEQQLLAAYKNQQREIARLQEFADRFRAKASKASQAQAKLKQIDRMDRIEAPTSESKEVSFSFPQPQRSGQRVIKLEGIHHSYGSNVVYAGVDLEIERGERCVLVGPNGAGKSTLLKILADVLQPSGGTRTLGHNVKCGYYSQYRVEMLKPERTVLEEALDTPQRVTEVGVRTLLGSFLFRGDDVFKRVSVLSGGEKSRLALVKLLLDPPNFLLMDEPTTHLDMPSIDALITALGQFQGTVVFISHDVYFIRKIANQVIHVRGGELRRYPSGYDYYLEKTKAESARAGLTAGVGLPSAQRVTNGEPRTGDRKEQRRLEAEQRQARAKERRSHEQRVKKLEAEIHELEAKQVELTAELEKPETYANGRANQVNRELMHVVDDLAARTAEWEAAATKLADAQVET
jgi:ATP-binding cassette, subfamily F, member 3